MSGSPALGSNVAVIPNLTVFQGLSAAGLPPVVFLQGTSTPLDGGQGFYAVNLTSNAANNPPSVIVDGGGFRWELVTNDTSSQIISALTLNGTRPALDPIMGGIVSIAAATTTDLSTVTQTTVNVTGSGVTIASLGTVSAGPIRILVFEDVNTLDYDATALILPGGANITTATGDVACFESLGGGNWRCLWYTEASGGTPGTLPISEGGTGSTTAVAANNALSTKGADIASAATINLAAATGVFVDITGNTGPVTSLGAVAAGAQFTLRFLSTPTLTHNATSLILPTAANITAAAGDIARFVSLGSGNWACAYYQRASGQPVATALSVASVAFTSTSGVIGTNTNNNAAAGSVGEIIESTVLVGSAVSLTTATPADITSISLTAGDWDVWGSVGFSADAATTMSLLAGWISSTSATGPTAPNGGAEFIITSTFPTGSSNLIPTGMRRFSLAGTTTIYLTAQASFAVNTMSAYGYIGARRVR